MNDEKSELVIEEDNTNDIFEREEVMKTIEKVKCELGLAHNLQDFQIRLAYKKCSTIHYCSALCNALQYSTVQYCKCTVLY